MIRDRLIHYASGLRFPRLLALAAAVFVLDLIFPDAIPFADEILLGLITLLLGTLKKRNPKSERPIARDKREGKKTLNA